MAKRTCPICSSPASKPLFDGVIDDFDGTIFDLRVLVEICQNCGFVFNCPDFSTSGLEDHYENEALYQTEAGYGVGGTTPADLERYSRYYSLMEPHITSKDAKIIDVGCSKGGFLNFLRSKGFHDLTGVELDPICAEYARKNHQLTVLEGSASSLPLAGKSSDVLTYSHVLEHIENPLKILEEARRVLKDDGLLFIEVPNALSYDKAKLFDYYYWLGMREHINHFDSAHLSMLLASAGFDSLEKSEVIVNLAEHPTPQEGKYAFPMLAAVFKKSSVKEPPHVYDTSLSSAITRYITQETTIAEAGRQKLSALAKSGKPVYIWGIALEFFCLYSFGGLKDCNIQSLIDKSPFKQTKTVNGLPIQAPEVLKSVGSEAVVILTSSFHAGAMQKYLMEIAFSGDVLVFP